MNKFFVRYEDFYKPDPAEQWAEYGDDIVVSEPLNRPAQKVFTGWTVSSELQRLDERKMPGDELTWSADEFSFALLEEWDYNDSMALRREFDNYLINHIIANYLKDSMQDKATMQQVARFEQLAESSKNQILFILNARRGLIRRPTSTMAWL